ncbi:hypothetical protein [Pyxidicoccus sp. MSG2]|uniref:hypothetical protein n=1 Tax=Pyxidicoccus sp. MSG2 TaxID=2996790 RepID=UPI00227058A9|nr:hypothetical protein [Pyxidicoccus sp. MSG2]MCY1014551.1 hypothetical protein [Pyxidicoccus sp. MSG2]
MSSGCFESIETEQELGDARAELVRVAVTVPIDHCMLQGIPGTPYWQTLQSNCVGNGACGSSANAECQAVGDVYLCPCQMLPEGCAVSELLPGLGSPQYAQREAASAKLLSCCTHDTYLATIRAQAASTPDEEVRVRLQRGAEACSAALHPCGTNFVGGIKEQEGRCVYRVLVAPDTTKAETNTAACAYDAARGLWVLKVSMPCKTTQVQLSSFSPNTNDTPPPTVLGPSNCAATVTVPANMLPSGLAAYAISPPVAEKVDGVSTAPELCGDEMLRAEAAADLVAGGVPADTCTNEPIGYTDWNRQPLARAITCGGVTPGYYWTDTPPAPVMDAGTDGGGTGGLDGGAPPPPPIQDAGAPPPPLFQDAGAPPPPLFQDAGALFP